MDDEDLLERRYERLLRAWSADRHGSTVLLARRFLAHYPDFAPAWCFLAQSLIGLARYREAEEAVSKALELAPDDAARRRLYSDLGHMHKQRGEFEQAAEWYGRARDVDPDNASGLIYLGGIFARQGRFPDAEEAYRSATRCLYGVVSEAYYNLGLVLRSQERFDEAAGCFREAILRDRDYRKARKALRDVELCIKIIKGRADE